jgi:glucose-1-phosphate adenylyltransferase
VSEWRDYSRDVAVVILGGGRGARLDPLTRTRSKPAVPFAGQYRLIDIPISNAIHSGMRRMFVLTQYNSLSLHRHIALTYRFDAFSSNFVQILAAQQTMTHESWFQGTADAVRRNLPAISDPLAELTLILSGDHLYRMDYRDMVRTHVENDADLTLAVMPCPAADIAHFGAVRVDPSGRIVEFREKPKTDERRAGMEAGPELLARYGIPADRPYLASMGIYLFKSEVLDACLDNDLQDFGHHVLPLAVEKYRMQAHLFDGYWRDIGTIRSFYDAHMDLLEPKAHFDFHDRTWPIFTQPRYLPGTRLTNCRFYRTVLAGGGVVSDSTVEESVVGVRTVMRDAAVRRSLIFGCDPEPPEAPAGAPPLGIGRGSIVTNAIVDKNARIGANVRITNEAGVREADGPGYAIREGLVVVLRNGIIPDGTVI